MAKIKDQAQADAPGQAPTATLAVTKTEAVRQALAALGPEAMPARIRDFVAQQFGVAMSLNHISNVKSSLARKPASPHAAARTPAADDFPGRGSVRIEDVEAAKALVQRLGLARLHALIDLVAH